MSLPPAVSPEVIIMTRAELRAREQAAYKRGGARGRFEERSDMNNPERKQPETKPENGRIGAAGQGCE